jgi:predicted NBD/HSP70 family sugar kinase
VLDAAGGLCERLVAATGLPADRIDSAVVGIPGVIEARTGRVQLAENVPGLEGTRFGQDLQARLGLPVSVDNDVNLAALGEQWLGVARGVDDFAFLSVGTGLGAGLVLRGELHRGHHGAAGEVDWALGAGIERDTDPCAGAVSALARDLAAAGRQATTLMAPYPVPAIFEAARRGDPLAREVVREEARRIALHVSPIAAVADVALVVLGGGIGVNGDLLLEPVRTLLVERLPYPPRVETSSLGDAAVLSGALAVGHRAALDNVFTRRATRRVA